MYVWISTVQDVQYGLANQQKQPQLVHLPCHHDVFCVFNSPTCLVKHFCYTNRYWDPAFAVEMDDCN